MWIRLICAAILAHVSLGVWAASGKADAYPSKPIRLIVGFPAGGSDDYTARVIGPKLTDRFGQIVIVDNRPELRNIVQMEDVRAKFAAQGLEVAGSTPDEFRAIVDAEVTKWARIIKDARITAN